MRLVFLTAVAMIAFAANSVLNRMAVAQGAIDAQSFALIRLLAGAVVLAGLLVARWGLRGQRIWPGIEGRIAGVLGLIVYMFGFSMAYRQLAAGTGALILFGSVQVTMFAGAIWAAERLRPGRWIGAGLAFLGLWVLVAPGFVAGAAGPMAMMAMAGGGWGIYSLVGRRSVDPLAGTAWNFILAVPLGLGIWALWAGFDPVVVSAPGVALAVASGGITSALGYALWYAILPRLGAARAAVAQLTVPVIAAAAGVGLLDEVLTPRFVVAALVVLVGVVVASL